MQGLRRSSLLKESNKVQMRSIRARFTYLITFAVIISVLSSILIFSLPVSDYISDRTDDVLRLVCAERQEALDNNFNSIEQSVDTVADYAQNDLVTEEDIDAHISKTEKLFSTIAPKTKGTLTYYYRIDPSLAGDKGFWYQSSDSDGTKFKSSELTKIGEYDPDNISRVGWYYIPKKTGEPVWIEPYMNDNMGVKMISYVVPVYRDGQFFGVVGIDFSYESLVANMEDIDEFSSGYAFLTNRKGEIIDHKELESGTSIADTVPPEILDSADSKENAIIRYSYNGTEKRAASAELSNNMRLFVTVDEKEVSEGWKRLISIVLVSAAVLVLVFILITSWLVKRITRPLSELTNAAAAFNSGDYNVELKYDNNDEIGILTHAFRQMRDNAVSQIGNLNTMAYKDALTSLRNKSAMDGYMADLDEQLASAPEGEKPEFAICMFDCNDLKEINDSYGHDKGDLYLKASCRLICEEFKHSAVFRVGGDEFVAIMQNTDYDNRNEVCRNFDIRTAATVRDCTDPWEKISVARGIAVYDPETDTCAADVLKRADEQMYEYKKHMKGNA